MFLTHAPAALIVNRPMDRSDLASVQCQRLGEHLRCAHAARSRRPRYISPPRAHRGRVQLSCGRTPTQGVRHRAWSQARLRRHVLWSRSRNASAQDPSGPLAAEASTSFLVSVTMCLSSCVARSALAGVSTYCQMAPGQVSNHDAHSALGRKLRAPMTASPTILACPARDTAKTATRRRAMTGFGSEVTKTGVPGPEWAGMVR